MIGGREGSVNTVGGRLSYRRFVRPRTRGWNTRHWFEWLAGQHVAPSVRSDEVGVCSLCRTPTSVGSWGTPYEQCMECRSKYSGILDGFVPMCYSIHEGLESLIWRSKNDPDGWWLKLPLASLLWTFTQKHIPCLEAAYGGPFDLRLTTPSHPGTRNGVNHLEDIVRRVPSMIDQWDFTTLQKSSPRKAETRRRSIDENAFVADASVNGKRVLLLDDTYTSGSTLASAAYALKKSGAKSVVGLTFGRQLGANWDLSRSLVEDVRSRELEIGTCAVHVPRPRA